jgi:hypothetical protein
MQTNTVLSQIVTPGSSKPGTIDWYSLLQFGLSALATLVLWGMALSMVALGLSQRLGSTVQAVDDLQLFMVAAGMAFCGVLLLPSVWYSLAQIVGRPAERTPDVFHRLRPTLLILAYPVLIGLGYWISQIETVAWLLLPPIHVLAISLPVLWLAYLAVRGLPTGSPQRASGVFASGLTLAPLLILVGEVAAILAGLGMFIVLLAMRPELAETLTALAERLMAAAPSPEIVLRILQPVLSNPVVIFTILLFVAVIIPLIEELIKPLGVWLLAGRKLAPAEGFAAGVLSGTGYALVESLFLGSSSQDWALLAFARIGTGVMHILTAGLVGWALVNAWTQPNKPGRYLHLGAVYLLAVLLHGLWNGLTLTSALANLIEVPAAGESLFFQIGQFAPYILGGLATVSFLALLSVNRALVGRQTAQVEDV